MKPEETLDDPLQMVRQYWATVVHFKWWILLGALAITLSALTYIARMPDSYRATTTILVDPQKIPEKFVASTISVDLQQRLTTISQTVMSTTRLQEIIEQLNLYPEMRRTAPMEQVIDAMRKDITIEVKQGSGISTFSITYQSKSKELVAPVANQLAARFIGWNLAIREGEVTKTKTFLALQLEKSKQTLEQQERALREFKMAHVGETPEAQNTNVQMLSQLNAQMQANSDALNRLDIQRTVLLRSEQQGTAAATTSRPVSERARLEAEKRQLEDKLAALRRKYTADYPDTVEASQQLERVKEQLRALPHDSDPLADTGKGSDDNIQLMVINRETKRLNEEQHRLEQQISMYRARVEASPLREQQMIELTRNYEVSKAEYQSLLDKTHSAEMAEDLESNQQAERFTILDPARNPERPFKPNRSMIMVGSLFGALVLCVALAVGIDTLNPTVKSETEVKAMMPANLPVLVTIPIIETLAERRRQMLHLVVGSGIAVLACLAEVAFYWKVHPFL
jgi:polysaccharide biosynthesis transport protein